MFWTCSYLRGHFNARTFKFDTNVVVSVSFDISSRFCQIHGFVIRPPHGAVLTWNKRDPICIDSIGNHEASVVFPERMRYSCSRLRNDSFKERRRFRCTCNVYSFGWDRSHEMIQPIAKDPEPFHISQQDDTKFVGSYLQGNTLLFYGQLKVAQHWLVYLFITVFIFSCKCSYLYCYNMTYYNC